MNNWFFEMIRDCALLAILILLAREAYNRTKTFITEHKNSIVHELDKDFLDYLYTAQRQLHFLEQHELHAHTFAHEIAHIKDTLATIEEKYKKNSPALALLGPIGSTAIITKEHTLQEKLLATLNDLGKILTTIDNSDQIFTPAATLHSCVEINKARIKNIMA